MSFLAGRLRWLAEGFEAERKEYLRTAFFIARQAQLAYFLVVAVYLNAVLLCRSVTLEVVLVSLRFPAGSPASSVLVYIAAFAGGLIAILVLVAVFELLASVLAGRELLELKRADCHPNGMTGRLLYAAILATRDEDQLDGQHSSIDEQDGTLPLAPSLSDGAEAAFARAKRGRRIAVPQRLRERVVSSQGKGARRAKMKLQGYDAATQSASQGAFATRAEGPADSPPVSQPASTSGAIGQRTSTQRRGRRLSVSSVDSMTEQRGLAAKATGWQVRVGCQWWDWLMQLAIHVGLELGPLLAAVVVNLTTGRLTAALSAYIVTGGLMAMLLTWIYSLVILAQVLVFLAAVAVDHCCCCCAVACCDALTSPVLCAQCCWRAAMVVTCNCCNLCKKTAASEAADSTARATHTHDHPAADVEMAVVRQDDKDDETAQTKGKRSGAASPADAPKSSAKGLQHPGIVQSFEDPMPISALSIAMCLACWFDGGPLTSRDQLIWFLGAHERTQQHIKRKFEEDAAGYSCGMLGCQWHEHLCFSFYRYVLSPDAQRGNEVSCNPSRSALPGITSVVVAAIVFLGLLAGLSSGVVLSIAVALAVLLLVYILTGLLLAFIQRCAGRTTDDASIPEEIIRRRLEGHEEDSSSKGSLDKPDMEKQRSEQAVKDRLTGDNLLPWVDSIQTCCFYSCCCFMCPAGKKPVGSSGQERQENAKGRHSISQHEEDKIGEIVPCCGAGCRLAFLTPRHAVAWILLVAATLAISFGGWFALGQQTQLSDAADEESETRDDLTDVPAEQLTAIVFILGGLALLGLDLLWIALMLPSCVSSPIPGRLADDVREMHVAVIATFLTLFALFLGLACDACAPTFQIIAVIAAFSMLWRLYLLYDAATGRFSTAPWLAVVKQSYSLTRMAMSYTTLFGEPWVVSDSTLQLLVGYAKLDPAKLALQHAKKIKSANVAVDAIGSARASAESSHAVSANVPTEADDIDTELASSQGKDAVDPELGSTSGGGAAAAAHSADDSKTPDAPAQAWGSFRKPLEAPASEAEHSADAIAAGSDAPLVASNQKQQQEQQTDPAERVRALQRLPDVARRLLPGLRALVGSWEATSQMSWQNTPGFLQILETSVSPVPHPTGPIAAAGITLGIGLFLVLLVGSVVVTDQVHEATDRPLHGNFTAKPGEDRLGRRYPACDLQLDRAGRLTVMDAILASQLAYRTSEDAFDSDFSAWFQEPQDEAQWTLVRRVNETADVSVGVSDQPQSVLRYFVAESGPWNTRMVGVRGTTVGRDVVADLDIFAEGALLDAALALLPAGAYMESDWKAWLAARVSDLASPLRAIGVDDSLRGIEGYLKQLDSADQAANRRMDTIVVGHSLGGAFAILVGARKDMRAVGVSAPGLGMTRGKFDVSAEALQRHGFSLHSEHDLVSLVDDKLVPAQAWPCDLDQWGTSGCHMLDAPWETFSQSCGDIHGRTMLATTGERSGEYL